MAFFMNSFKYIIFLVNLIFFALGIYLFYNTYQQLGENVFNLDSDLKSPIYFTLVIAAIIVFISFLGCCGTCNENPCMIKAYALLILVCVILQAAVIIMAWRIDPEQVSQSIKVNLIRNFANQSESVQESIQLIQSGHKCCAVDSWTEYGENVQQVPNSCCEKFKEEDKPNSVGQCDRDVLDKSKGCKIALQELISDNHKGIYIVVGCVFAFQLIVVVLSCALSKNIREQYNVV